MPTALDNGQRSPRELPTGEHQREGAREDVRDEDADEVVRPAGRYRACRAPGEVEDEPVGDAADPGAHDVVGKGLDPLGGGEVRGQSPGTTPRLPPGRGRRTLPGATEIARRL
jgi:hypothetical protein